jgi:hypothetical protein
MLAMTIQPVAPATAPRGRGQREARVRPEYAGRYPGLTPGRWEPAATVTDRVLAAALLRGRDTALWRRVLLDEHFEFRGGAERDAAAEGPRPRREDR